jgi:tetratricopeptide (TPR) repeat protein
MDLGRYGDAETEFRKSIELRNDYAPSHFELGNALYKKYNFNGAITEYQAAIRLDPEHFQAMNNIASVYVEARKYSEAEKVLKEAVRLKPDFAVGYKNLGVLYETRLNNKTLALDYYGKYLKARPDSSDRDIVKSWIRTLGGRS